jgi:hypothetical protein
LETILPKHLQRVNHGNSEPFSLIIDEPLCWKSETIQRIGCPVGTIFVKIVGKRYYEGNIKNETRLEREPQNKHDHNAIKVVETQDGIQVGHVERLSARGSNLEFFKFFSTFSVDGETHLQNQSFITQEWFIWSKGCNQIVCKIRSRCF